MIDRPKFKEMDYEEFRYYDKNYARSVDQHGYFDSVEMKMDGIWGCMVIKDGEYKMYSRTGKVKKQGAIKHHVDMILLGEYMKGSHWGHRMGFDGKFFVFDCLQYKKDLKIYQLTTRRKYIIRAINDIDTYNNVEDIKEDELLGNIVRLPHYPLGDSWHLWYSNVKRKGYEGLVLKNSKAKWDDIGAWARIKNTTEIEYMCIGFEPADPESRYAGQVGAVRGSLIDKPCNVKCGGLTDEQRELFTADPTQWIGQVFKATGHGWFPSGSIRHPKFAEFRSDKSMTECTYDQIPEMHREVEIVEDK
jgi:ATP-dependent DNA ligase